MCLVNIIRAVKMNGSELDCFRYEIWNLPNACFRFKGKKKDDNEVFGFPQQWRV